MDIVCLPLAAVNAAPTTLVHDPRRRFEYHGGNLQSRLLPRGVPASDTKACAPNLQHTVSGGLEPPHLPRGPGIRRRTGPGHRNGSHTHRTDDRGRGSRVWRLPPTDLAAVRTGVPGHVE